MMMSTAEESKAREGDKGPRGAGPLFQVGELGKVSVTRRLRGRVKHMAMAVCGGAEELASAKALNMGSSHDELEKQRVGQGGKR